MIDNSPHTNLHQQAQQIATTLLTGILCLTAGRATHHLQQLEERDIPNPTQWNITQHIHQHATQVMQHSGANTPLNAVSINTQLANTPRYHDSGSALKTLWLTITAPGHGYPVTDNYQLQQLIQELKTIRLRLAVITQAENLMRVATTGTFEELTHTLDNNQHLQHLTSRVIGNTEHTLKVVA